MYHKPLGRIYMYIQYVKKRCTENSFSTAILSYNNNNRIVLKEKS